MFNRTSQTATPPESPKRPVPRMTFVDVEVLTQPGLRRLTRLSKLTGMLEEEVVAAILESTPEAPAAFSSLREPVPAAGASLTRCQTLKVPVTPGLNRRLLQLSRLAGLPKARIAGLLLEDMPSRALATAMAALRQLHSQRRADLAGPTVAGNGSGGSPR